MSASPFLRYEHAVAIPPMSSSSTALRFSFLCYTHAHESLIIRLYGQAIFFCGTGL